MKALLLGEKFSKEKIGSRDALFPTKRLEARERLKLDCLMGRASLRIISSTK
jgi:hypothetical protein